jgi:hypothetical protein
MLLLKNDLPIAQILQPIYQLIPNSFRNTKLINFMKLRIYGLGFKQRPDKPVLPLKTANNSTAKLAVPKNAKF